MGNATILGYVTAMRNATNSSSSFLDVLLLLRRIPNTGAKPVASRYESAVTNAALAMQNQYCVMVAGEMDCETVLYTSATVNVWNENRARDATSVNNGCDFGYLADIHPTAPITYTFATLCVAAMMTLFT